MAPRVLDGEQEISMGGSYSCSVVTGAIGWETSGGRCALGTPFHITAHVNRQRAVVR